MPLPKSTKNLRKRVRALLRLRSFREMKEVSRRSRPPLWSALPGRNPTNHFKSFKLYYCFILYFYICLICADLIDFSAKPTAIMECPVGQKSNKINSNLSNSFYSLYILLCEILFRFVGFLRREAHSFFSLGRTDTGSVPTFFFFLFSLFISSQPFVHPRRRCP